MYKTFASHVRVLSGSCLDYVRSYLSHIQVILLRHFQVCVGHFQVMSGYIRGMSRSFLGHVESGSHLSHVWVMPELCPGMSRSCSSHARGMSMSCAGHVRVISNSCEGHIWIMPRSHLGQPCLGNVWVMSRHVQVMSWSCPGPVRVMSGSCPINIQVISMVPKIGVPTFTPLVQTTSIVPIVVN